MWEKVLGLGEGKGKCGKVPHIPKHFSTPPPNTQIPLPTSLLTSPNTPKDFPTPGSPVGAVEVSCVTKVPRNDWIQPKNMTRLRKQTRVGAPVCERFAEKIFYLLSNCSEWKTNFFTGMEIWFSQYWCFFLIKNKVNKVTVGGTSLRSCFPTLHWRRFLWEKGTNSAGIVRHKLSYEYFCVKRRCLCRKWLTLWRSLINWLGNKLKSNVLPGFERMSDPGKIIRPGRWMFLTWGRLMKANSQKQRCLALRFDWQ